MEKEWNIASKELYLAVKTKRFIILLSIYLIFLGLAIYFSKNSALYESPSVGRQSMFGASGWVYMTPVAMIFMGNSMLWIFFGSLLGILLGADSINREVRDGTIKVLLGHPIYRDQVVFGKFLGNAIALAIVVFIGFAFTIAMMLIVGIPMEGLSVVRLLVLSLLILLYTLVFLSLGIMISSLLKSPETAIIVAIGVAVFFAILYPIVSSMISESIVGEPPECSPVTIIEEKVINGKVVRVTETTMEHCEEIYQEWSEKKRMWERRINILNPATHFAQLMIYTFSGEEGGHSYLPLGESLAHGINDLAILIVELLFPFSVAYARFMTTDLR
ncbi:ABC transporter permease [Pyrococcus sp. ST04]|uniref:ABC transporter permease n=1 Tax=Pyrococcus sp. ST04 TaxID=1183377 RepID=UPI0002605AEC|nr:ABC transporter permease [Pyrococcus sp. ST04]AFK22791.1 ABC type transporter permease [Pyrococcus sp. ST04]